MRPGQTRAALAIGLSRGQAVAQIVLPQAVIRMLPAFGSVLSIAIKDTAIAAVIAVPEYMERSQTLAGQSFHPVEVFTVAGFGSSYRDAVSFAVLFLVLLARPRGLLGQAAAREA